MGDPIEAIRADEAQVAHETERWIKLRKVWTPSEVTIARVTSRAPTLFERYRVESRCGSFAEWLKTQGLPCA
jgi:hypothetical protein